MDKSIISAKVSIVGPLCSGKTSIVRRFISNEFDEHPNMTIAFNNVYKKMCIYGSNYDVMLSIWDTSGEEKYKSLCPLFVQNSQAIVIVFSLASINSKNEIEIWKTFVMDNCQSAKLYLVGNMYDLCEPSNEQIVEYSEIAQKMKADFYMTSAKTGCGINELFQTIACQISEGQLPAMPSRSVCKC